MAIAATDADADPVLAQAIDGTPDATDTAAPPFSLVDQHGQAVSLASLRGKAIGLTFLDPVCTSDCPVIAQEFRAADRILGASARQRTSPRRHRCQPPLHDTGLPRWPSTSKRGSTMSPIGST